MNKVNFRVFIVGLILFLKTMYAVSNSLHVQSMDVKFKFVLLFEIQLELFEHYSNSKFDLGVIGFTWLHKVRLAVWLRH